MNVGRKSYKSWLRIVPASVIVMCLVTVAGSVVVVQRQGKRGPDRGNPNWGGSAVLGQTALQAG